MTEIKDSLAKTIETLLEAKDLSQIEELSYIYGETSVYTALFIAISNRVNKSFKIRYTTPFSSEMFEKEIKLDLEFVTLFFTHYLRLQVSKTGKGRDGILEALKNAFKGMFLTQPESQQQLLGNNKSKGKLSDIDA